MVARKWLEIWDNVKLVSLLNHYIVEFYAGCGGKNNVHSCLGV
jgi:hypothetical protein